MATDTLLIMQTMDMALHYEGQFVRDADAHVVGIKPNPLSTSVFYAEELPNGSITFSIRTGDTIVAHGVLPELTYDGYDYFAELLIDIDARHRG